MRSVTTRYPVDRYLVESSNKFEMVNILDDDLWNTEPTLKPEDEIILRKLHEMLQSTADDLKLLSGELSKFHEPGVQIKTMPTPLDEEFNEKVHIEEIVNAKFHGYKIIDKSSSCVPEYKPRNDVTNEIKSTVHTQNPKIMNSNVQDNTEPILKKPINRNLGITRTKVLQINGNQDSTKTEKLNNGKIINAPAVAYSEFSYKYVEPKLTPRKVLQVQEMPSINIRSELKEQKVLQLDIIPESKESLKTNTITKNVAVVAVQHEIPKPTPTTTIATKSHRLTDHHDETAKPKPQVRKVSKMSACDSSGSTNISSDTQVKIKTQKRLLTSIKSPKHSAHQTRSDRKKPDINKKDTDKRSHLNLEEWRKKLNVVYGPSNTKSTKVTKTKTKIKVSPKKSNLTHQNRQNRANTLNNAEYIPYSKLTIGGARASDIEREISAMPNKNSLPLSPILDRIISSREHSFSKTSPRKSNATSSKKILTTSDENLLQEVIDIERTVSETLSKNLRSANTGPKSQEISSDTDEAKENESYVDDFEDEKSDHSGQSANQGTYSRHSNQSNKPSDEESNYSSDNDHNNESNDNNVIKEVHIKPSTSNADIHNQTYTKVSNLSFKNKIDIFEFVHAVDTHDSATQSNGTQKISPKETQTTPRCDTNIQPIHNDLWPSIDPNSRVEKMFELEKEFIKKLIIEEYGDILEKNITKPSTFQEIENKINIAGSQKNTQTSPAHVKSVMTSPTRTKTRTTSPFTALTVDHHTSPLIFVTNENDVKVETEEEEDLAISINLSSPRFSLRLPRNSQEVISNMGDSLPRADKKSATERKSSADGRKSTMGARRAATEFMKNNIVNTTMTSTSSAEVDSSEISSLGEVRLKRKFTNVWTPSDSESVSSTSSKYSSDLQSGILPLRSEGEMSLGMVKKSNKHNKSEGEASFGIL